LFVVPLVHWTRNLKKIKRSLAAHTQKLSFLQLESTSKQRYSEVPETECAICLDRTSNSANLRVSQDDANRHPIQTPYVTSCGHRYCYFCVSEKILQAAEEDIYWECLRCSLPVYNILRVQAEADDSDDNERVLDMGMS
jgi:peroxin-2